MEGLRDETSVSWSPQVPERFLTAARVLRASSRGPAHRPWGGTALPIMSGALVNLSLRPGRRFLARERKVPLGDLLVTGAVRQPGARRLLRGGAGERPEPTVATRGSLRLLVWAPVLQAGPLAGFQGLNALSSAVRGPVRRLCAVASHPHPWAALRIEDDAGGVLQIP